MHGLLEIVPFRGVTRGFTVDDSVFPDDCRFFLPVSLDPFLSWTAVAYFLVVAPVFSLQNISPVDRRQPVSISILGCCFHFAHHKAVVGRDDENILSFYQL